MFNTVAATGAQSSFYANNDLGQGVDVAVIDSGVAPIPGLDTGNVIQGPDFSFESHSAYAHNDTYGHGTMMASIIAGRDDPDPSVSVAHLTPYSWSDPRSFTGMAPGARVVSVKVADSSGAVDVTQMIAAIDWVVGHRHSDGLNIRVLNLSYGLEAVDGWLVDRLTSAVDAAWRAGIVVVAADGNNGQNELGVKADPGLNSPAMTHSVIAVGSYHDGGSPYNTVDDTLPTYTANSSGSNKRNPDFVAPGQHVLALHDGGAGMDDEIAQDCGDAEQAFYDGQSGAGFWNTAVEPAVASWPASLWSTIPPLTANWVSPVTGPDGRFVRGSGTSEAAAVTSGAVALLLSKNPSLTPDEVKDILVRSAKSTWGNAAGQQYRGAGEMRLGVAFGLTSARKYLHDIPTGIGTFDNARGFYISDQSVAGSHITQVRKPALLVSAGVTLHGNIDIFGNTIAKALHQAEVANVAQSDTDHTFMKVSDSLLGNQIEEWIGDPALAVGDGFVPDPLFGEVWDSAPWPALDWAGQPFADYNNASDPLTGHTWRGSRWSANGLSGSRWSTDVLLGSRWSTGSLLGSRWSGNGWRDGTWR
jgi:serine protease AprX